MKKFTMIGASLLMAGMGVTASAQDWYVRGAFNDYDPAGKAEWALTEGDVEKVFTGTIEIPAGEFSFNMMNSDGVIFVPITLSTFDTHPQEVEFTDNVFKGNCSVAWEEYEELFYWTCKDWTGGKLTITVNNNSNNPAIEFVKVEDDQNAGVKAISALETKDGFVVYNLIGKKVLETKDSLAVKSLTPGIYIVNGKKTVIR